MKAVYILEHGGVDKLLYGERPEPVVEPIEVKIRVGATALNHLDLFARAGTNNVNVGGFPRILGCDIAGEVVEVGREVRHFRPGDRVLFNHIITCGVCSYCASARDNLCPNRRSLGTTLDGGYAQYAKAPESNVYRIPDAMSFEEAAAIPLVFNTAWNMLVRRADLRAGETVLVMAAGSGVGSAAIQVAKVLGARVIATASADWKLERAKELGADAVINYSSGKFADRVKELTDGEGVDLVVDHIGASVWEENFASLKRNGRMVICGVTSGHRVSFHLGQLFTRNLSIIGSGGTGTKENLHEVMRLVHQGKLRGVVGKVFPLEEAGRAHETMDSRDFFGKLVLVP